MMHISSATKSTACFTIPSVQRSCDDILQSFKTWASIRTLMSACVPMSHELSHTASVRTWNSLTSRVTSSQCLRTSKTKLEIHLRLFSIADCKVTALPLAFYFKFYCILLYCIVLHCILLYFSLCLSACFTTVFVGTCDLQGRRSIWDRGDTSPQYLDWGTLSRMSPPPIFLE